jgi:Nucleotidyltransferase of unknown function (DUF6036)
MAIIESNQIRSFLEELGRRYSEPATLFLLGGSALCLLGSTRPTLDIDYVGDDLKQDNFQQVIEQVANDLQIEVEAVPIEHFVPIPDGSTERQIFFESFGSVDVFILDPYVIALSKIDRGFDTDIEDVVFLIQQDFVSIDRLEEVCKTALDKWQEYGLHPKSVHNHLYAVRQRL